MRKILTIALAGVPFLGFSAITPFWLRDAMISPNGQEIAFTYKGDIWKVPASGGEAVRLTTQPTYETTPIWSPDGKSLVFASDRYGSFDLFSMPAVGGTPTRLTFSSASETPEAFTPDGKFVLFSAAIQDPAESAMFPVARFTELYQVPVSGGNPKQILGTPAQMISYMPDGTFLYQDRFGMENEWRKHHTSSTARNIWQYNPKDGSHKIIIEHAGEDRNPVAANNGEFYFLSERNGGSMNVYKSSVSNPDAAKAVTNFKEHPVRFLSRSNNGTLCYTYDGEIYTQQPDGKPAKVSITVVDEAPDETYKMSLPTPSEFAVSPDGKSVAFIARGDVFVTSVDYKTTKQITSTPEAEKHIAWGHDSKSLVYASERDGKSNIYQATMGWEDDLNFPNATIITEKLLFKGDQHERAMPRISPDGKKLAYMLDRRKLAIKDIDSGKEKVLTDGTTITDFGGEHDFSWSPDSKWIAMEGVDRKHSPYSDIMIINAETGEMANLTQTGYFDESPRWVLDGNAILFASDRYGMRNHASWGSMQDVMIVFLNQKAYDEFALNKEDAELAEDLKNKKDDEKKKEEKKNDKKDDKKKDDKDEDSDGVEPIVVELANLSERTKRLTPFSSDLHGAILNSDGTELYFISTNGKENGLWKIDLREGDVSMSKSLSSGLKSFDSSADGKTLFITGSSVQKYSPSAQKLTPVSYSATFKIDPAKEREYMYDFMVREEQERFYDVNMHGVNWKKLTDHYRKFLPHIDNNYDWAEMASELLGELNVSHTGSGYRGDYATMYESTSSLGLLFDLNYDGKGIKVAEVVTNGPLDKSESKVAAGTIVEKINGQEITPENNYTVLLTDIAGRKTLVSFYDPATGERWEEVVKPISQAAMNRLLYNRWVANRAADVERWSNGRLGYVHIQSMNDPSFRTAYADILGKYYDREGIVIDVRNNGGGRLHEDIEVLFSGKKYLTQEARGEDVCDMPSRRWNKPSIMVTSEACYSNAHGTPWVYKTRNLGKIVGMPVPGTMTSVNWVTLQDPTLYFGIPVIGYRTSEGTYLENSQLEPDILIRNNPADIVKGEDAQLRKAVEELLKEL